MFPIITAALRRTVEKKEQREVLLYETKKVWNPDLKLNSTQNSWKKKKLHPRTCFSNPMYYGLRSNHRQRSKCLTQHNSQIKKKTFLGHIKLIKQFRNNFLSSSTIITIISILKRTGLEKWLHSDTKWYTQKTDGSSFRSALILNNAVLY